MVVDNIDDQNWNLMLDGHSFKNDIMSIKLPKELQCAVIGDFYNSEPKYDVD